MYILKLTCKLIIEDLKKIKTTETILSSRYIAIKLLLYGLSEGKLVRYLTLGNLRKITSDL